MMPRSRNSYVGLLLASLVVSGTWLIRGLNAGPDQRKEPSPALPTQTASLPFTGTASCAGRSCHGSLTPLDRFSCAQNEYTLWTGNDPHARAFQSLLSPLAKEMARQLDIGPAHESQMCLACHTQPAAARSKDKNADVVLREHSLGVGCEACHGNARTWLDAHISQPWRTKNAKEKQRDYGVTDLADTATLVKTCTGCHVGAPAGANAPARDVNHDLIAAGHPRLMFEASSYFANLPRHWKEKPRDEAKLWATGQVVSAEAALELLQHRVKDKNAPWPEFAEYDCTGCHHALTEPSWRQARGQRGALAWGTWYFAVTKQMLTRGQDADALLGLAALMDRLPARRLDVGNHVQAAMGSVRRLHASIAGSQPNPFLEKDMVWLTKGLAQASPSWDAAEQAFLMLQASNAASPSKTRTILLNQLLSERAQPVTSRFDPQDFIKRLLIQKP